jgi:hypothetical protein
MDAHAAWSVKNYKAANATLNLPCWRHNRVRVQVGADWLDAPDMAFYGTGAASRTADRTGYFYREKTVGVTTSLQATRSFTIGGGLERCRLKAALPPEAELAG